MLLSGVADTWKAVLDDCAAATQSIDFEQYIVGADRIGHKLLELFTRKAQEGVRVRVLCDGLGSRKLLASGAFRDLEEAGGEVLFYNVPSLSQLFRLPPRIHRDHRKGIIVDKRISYLGGVCFEDRMADWRDTMVRFEGLPPRFMDYFFDLTWRRVKIQRGDCTQSLPAPERGARGNPFFHYLVNSPERPVDRELYDYLRERLNHAKRSIRLTTPYFIPEHSFIRLLRRAQKRGVEVTLLLPGLSDHLLADILSRSFTKRLRAQRCGVGYYRDRMIHAKVAIVDGEWGMVSSLNLDRLSFRLNLENGVASENPDFVRALDAQFEKDLANCDSRPPELPGWYRYAEFFLGPLARVV